MTILTAVIISFLLTLSYRTIPLRARSLRRRYHRTFELEFGPFGRIRRYYALQLFIRQNPPRRRRRRNQIERHLDRILRTEGQEHHQPGFIYGPFTPLGEPAPAYQAQDLPRPIPRPAPHNVWDPVQDPAPEEAPDWEAARIQINRILRERENENPAPPRGQSPVIPPRPDTPHPVLDPRLRINPVTEYIETLIPVEPPVLTNPVVEPPAWTPVTPDPDTIVLSRSVTPVPILVQNRPLDFNPSIIYHHRIHPDSIPLITAPIYEPASRSHIWSYCPEHRLFEEIRTGEQHNESAVVFRGICPEDVIRHDVTTGK